ncbi:MAG: tetratricopeptide repeat protein [Aquincola tertiaricarbonis]|uniref:tetratricopeptide repeat protein n=1 Tax=Aquincola tertiaricarbonis TaxID=391953 RepID=UPI000614A205|nr:tetratricopeptide repeat protein [Aquincola tertiaricarbonis]
MQRPPAPAPQAEVTFDEALRMAIGLHRDGRWEGAEKLYRRLLAFQPGDANTMHFLGMLLHQRGQRAEALPLLQESVRLDPTVAAWQNNLGNALLDAGRGQEAADAYERSFDLDPGNLDVLNNLGCMLMRLRRFDEAEASLRTVLERNADYADAHFNLASLLSRVGRLPEAYVHFARTLELKPQDTRSRRLLGIVYAQAGRLAEAAGVFREWLAVEPDSVQARHHLAAVTGDGVPERAPNDYVVDVFDSFAGSFDERLTALEYRAPQLVGDALAEALGAPPAKPTLDVLDAGCGTGLCAQHLRPYARRLVGVDLSPGMLAQARLRGGYDSLQAAELTTWLAAHPSAFHVIVSADTLCYFGRLDEVLGAAARSLRPGGLLVFTVEARSAGADHLLEPHGRYSHTQDYVQRSLAAAGLAHVQLASVALRKEAGQQVAGWLVTSRRQDA